MSTFVEKINPKNWKFLEKLKLDKAQRKDLWDKVTTGFLIFLFCTPVMILAYIILWFLLK